MKSESGTSELIVRVSKKDEIADGIFMFELRSHEGTELPAFTAGSHITVSTPSGQKRRYSLCNDSSERDRYVIAIKQEKNGRGGSLSFTRDVNVGDVVSVEAPANEFEMSAAEPRNYIFVAGGIGITPIRSMILQCVRNGKQNFKLFYFARTPEMMAFREEFEAAAFAQTVVLHNDNGDRDQAYDLWPILEEQKGAHLYCCGPRGLMDSVRDMTGHWPETAVHFEDFGVGTTSKPDDKPFEVKLARSGNVYTVDVGASILDTLRVHGHELASSCESGTCGTCRVRFTDGTPDHRDLVLSDKEQKNEIMICVSRAKSASITLDI
ncbi:PDR/VanB family oxidoreductase [Pseudorhodoplanes sinuspersici]|uniref:Phthalate 4,5-dioxygenase n=1 Tax=Pseudorhodoplanes sinuspersici TaxID=1235591 RepID=A0A1W7A133_9HYPH|nr:PDR/VanB family oxidoreductase [Pseudorhodoplanes sinuspersici]ARQ02715.1 phthalate 4,5-dioxygenase [Pseudorhodoplanes sinuspersici]RKE68213.1 phthalate 4,5-dioxygenase reductase subunit [Pseudorhodoplanes sinuspersici]